MTHIKGLEIFGIDLQTMTKDCQKKFACSATYGLIPGMVKDKEVIVQGHLSYEIQEYLINRCSIPSNLIQIVVAKNVKPKKK